MKEIIKKIVFRHTNLGKPSYPYNLDPVQLAFIIESLEKIKSNHFNILEIGVARGMTSRFICEYIRQYRDDFQGKYFALDTFNSFTAADVAYEITNRGKNKKDFDGFAYNDFSTWSKNFINYDFIKPIQSDCSKFNYDILGPLNFVILDVDLYRPTIQALPNLYSNLAPGGRIMVDDVKINDRYDGAHQAYHEFCEKICHQPIYIGKKSAYIEKL